MEKILKVTDWIKNKPQFEFVKSTGFAIVKRISDGTLFEQAETVMFSGKACTIQNFESDCIHVTLIHMSTTSEISSQINIKFECCNINEIETYNK